jgi:chromosomal replication initiator protein
MPESKSSLLSIPFDSLRAVQLEATQRQYSPQGRKGIMTDIWEGIKNEIKESLPEGSFSLWIGPINLVETKDDTLVLGCPNKFSLNWITENYIGIIREKLKLIGDGKYKLDLRVKSPEKPTSPPGIFNPFQQLSLPNIPRQGRALNHNFTFDRFVVGKCNDFAYSASRALALESHISYSSLFILSNTGLGKSHLSQATSHAIIENSPKLKVIYITAEDFLNEMIFGLKNNRIDEFKNKYRRSCDVLLLEEVHFLGGKERTQLELGFVLDALANDHKRIIFTSSLLPKDIPNFTKELSSRLTSGIITTLEKPDYQTRVKILARKSTEQGMKLSEEITHLLATRLRGDIREMESALSCLKAKSEMLKAEINADLAKQVLRSHSSEESSIAPEDIKNLVCQYFKIDPQILESKSRKEVYAYPRAFYVYLCRHHTGMTVEEIGKTLNRSHSTVLYATAVIEHRMKVDKKVRNQVEFLRAKLKDLPE